MKKRSFLFLAGALCLIAVGSLLCAKVYYERKVRGDIEHFFATLPAAVTVTPGSIEVSLLDRAATIRNIKGSCNLGDAGGEMAFSVDALTATGLNLGAFTKGAGVTTLAKSIALTNMATTSPYITTTIAHYRLENIRGDFALLQEKVLAAMPLFTAITSAPAKNKGSQQEFVDATIGILQAYETLTIDKGAISGYVYKIPQPAMEVSVGEMEFLDSSIRKIGPFTLKNLQAKIEGKPIFSLEMLRVASMIMPDFVPLLKVSGSNASMPVLVGALKGQPFAVRDMVSKNFLLRSPSAPDSVLFSLADLTFDYTTEPNHMAKLAFSGMKVSKSPLNDGASIPPKAFALLPDVLAIEGGFDLAVMAEDKGPFTVACKTFRLNVEELGALAFNIDIAGLNPLALAMGSPGNATLKSSSNSLTDNGFSNFYFTFVGEEENKTAAQMRDQTLNELADARAGLPNETLQSLMDSFIQFMKAPGKTFTVSITPEQPVPLGALQQRFFSSPGTLGITSSVTPD